MTHALDDLGDERCVRVVDVGARCQACFDLGDNRVQRAAGGVEFAVVSRFACGAALAATFVPSTAMTPTRTRPDSAHSASTAPNSSANARSWRWRKRAIVV
jgi:hypothetical protein